MAAAGSFLTERASSATSLTDCDSLPVGPTRLFARHSPNSILVMNSEFCLVCRIHVIVNFAFSKQCTRLYKINRAREIDGSLREIDGYDLCQCTVCVTVRVVASTPHTHMRRGGTERRGTFCVRVCAGRGERERAISPPQKGRAHIRSVREQASQRYENVIPISRSLARRRRPHHLAREEQRLLGTYADGRRGQ